MHVKKKPCIVQTSPPAALDCCILMNVCVCVSSDLSLGDMIISNPRKVRRR